MQIKVESCWNGVYHTKKFSYKNHWFTLRSDDWNRETATEALDILEKVYHICRKNVRFKHV